jgi:hypothetical protein
MWFISCEVNKEERKVVIVVVGNYPLGGEIVKERKFCFLRRFRDENLVVFCIFVYD